MHSHEESRSHHAWSHLALIVCLASAMLGYALTTTSGGVALADPPRPLEEETAEEQTALEAQPPTPTPPETQGVGREREAETRAGLAALEIAHRQGPEAVIALLDTLRGEALDLAMDDVVEAHRQLARSAPPRPATLPISEAEELAALQAQAALDVASRARSLARHNDPADDQNPTGDALPVRAPNVPNAPTADRTVGDSCDYATIGDAITAANPGDRLLIEGGRTFTENLSIAISLTLQGGYDGCASGSSDLTTIDGGGLGRVMYIYQNLTVTLENLNVVNGNSPGNGAGIFVRWNTHLRGTNLNIHNNTSSLLGGGLRLQGGSATFTNTEIFDNVAMNGAGVYAELYNGYAPELNLSSYADVYGNDALSGSGLGGGVYMREGTVSLANCSDLYYNDAIEGGGAYLVTSTLTIYGDCSEIMLNTATGNGGGVYAVGSTVNMDRDAELFDNTAGTSGAGNGGGAYLDDSTLWSDKALIHYNTAGDYGGGVYATNNSLLDMDLGGHACAGPRCSRLSYNTASIYGGGVYARDYSEVDLRQIFVEDNSAEYGGGIYAYQGPVYLYNDLLARNDATGGTGDGLRLFTGASLNGSHDTLAHNDAGGATTGNAIDMSGASLTLDNSIVWGHASSIDAAMQTVTCSDIEGGYTGTDNLNVDPSFIDPSVANFHLQSLSPAIDRCATGETRDFDDELRPLTHVRPATPYDMGADEASARVGINGAACAYGRIQDAVDAASSGDAIQAAADVFTETVDISGKNLTIAGGYDTDCTTYITGTTTVNGGGVDSVFEVTNGVVALRNLNITGGDAGNGGGVGALSSNSRVTLDNTDVFGNKANNGGGVYISFGSVLTITNDSDIHHNTATAHGGGARVWGRLVGAETSSDIYDNTAPDGGGAAVPGGVLVLHGSDMNNNHAIGAQGRGGGIYVISGGVVTLTGNAYIYSGNTAYDGAGIHADDARLYMQGHSVVIRQNTATNNGGGVYLTNNSQLYSTGTTIGYGSSGSGNEAVLGAGIYAVTSTIDFEGNIYNNLASSRGAGIYAGASTITLTNASVGGTEANQPNQLGTNGYFGAGLYLTDGTHATLDNTTVASNTFQASTATYGGGAYVAGGSVVTLTNSRVERHLALSASDGRGAGIYVSNSTVTLDNSQVLSNTAGTVGGGLRLYGTSTLDVLNGSELRNNHALNGEGGGVAAANGTPDINVSDSTLEHNVANTDGGAIYLSAGTLDLTGWWDVRDNTAGGNGGAVAVTGSGNADFYADGGTSHLSSNTASGNGGALYVGNSNPVWLDGRYGFSLNVNTNSASGNGGAAYVDGGATLLAHGRVQMAANHATGDGGALYLDGGSAVELSGQGDDSPEILGNWAGNGGAIYARDASAVTASGTEFGTTVGGNRAGGGDGGSVYLSGSVLTSTNSTFHHGAATLHGGAIAAYTSTLAIDADYATCDPLAARCSNFYSNIADSDANDTGNGGAIYVYSSTLRVNHTTLHHNVAERGGAIFQMGVGAIAQVANSLIYSNTVNYPLGAGIRTQGGAFTVTHVTIADNAGGTGYSQSGTASAAHNSIAWGNGSGGFLGTFVTVTCNIDQDGNAGTVVDPQFVDPDVGEDYHLLGSSPAIDACTTGLTPDLDNVSRPAGSGYDVGAYEYPYGVAFAPDRSGAGLSPGVVMYTHTLTNTGGVADTFALSVQSDQGWATGIDPVPMVALASGASTPVTVTLTIPVGVLSGTVNTTAFTATSVSDPYLTARVTDTTTVFTTNLPIYTLAVDVVGNGLVTRSPSQTAYISGTVVQLEAMPDTGWTFVEWSGDLTGGTNPDTILVDGDKMVTATFASTSCVPVSGAGFIFAPTEPVVGDTVTFTGSVAAGDAPTYAWNWGDGSAVQAGNPIVHSFPSTSTEQTYTLVMTASNSCPSQDTASQPVTVRPRRICLPVVMRNYGP
jgi:hypothetical protein